VHLEAPIANGIIQAFTLLQGDSECESKAPNAHSLGRWQSI